MFKVPTAFWHDRNPVAVSAFLTEKGIAFETAVSELGHGHTAFIAEAYDRRKNADLCADKFGRFALERLELELTPEEEAAVAKERADAAAILAEKERAYRLRKEREAGIFEAAEEEEFNEEDSKMEVEHD